MARVALSLLLLLAGASAASAQVVITEVSSDPAFVELYNAGAETVPLRRYRITGDVTHVIYADVSIQAGATFVLAADSGEYRTSFPNAAAPHPVPLRTRVSANKGELQLHDPSLLRVDWVRYGSTQPGRTWQRRAATTPYRGPANWHRRPPTPGAFHPQPLGPLLLDDPRRDPVQPHPGTPITVSVRSQGDPREVTVVWTTRREEGRVPLRPSADDPGRWVGQLPAQPALTLLRYRFEAVGVGGTASLTRPWRRPPLRALIGRPPPAISPPLYHLELSPTETAALGRSGRLRLPATFAWFRDGQATFADAALQVRGGTWTRTWKKKGWTIRFPAQRGVRGQRRLILRGCYRDLTYLREVLGLELFRAAGVPAPRARAVRVYVNGEFFGLYVEVDPVDDAFLDRHDLAGAALYQAEEPYAAAQGVDGLWSDGRRLAGRAIYRARYTKRTARDEPHADLQRFIEGYLDCPEVDLASWFRQHLNVETYVRYLAVCALITHWDSVAKNYYWARDRERDGRWTVLPWDLDLTFGDYMNRQIHTAPLLLGTRATPVDHRHKPWHRLRDRFLQVADHRRRLYQTILDLTEGPFRAAPLGARIDEWTRTHQTWIVQDRQKWGLPALNDRPLPYSPTVVAREVAALKRYVRLRRAFVRDEAARLLKQEGAAPPPPASPSEPQPLEETLDARRRQRAGIELWILLMGAVGLVIYLRNGGTREVR